MTTVFKDAKNEMAFLKCGIMGFAGSGKTYTAKEIVLGLHKFIKSKKPVTFFDTETGSDFILPFFKNEKVPLKVLKSRAFADLLTATREAQKMSDILIIDSITHVWTELLRAFQKSKNADRLLFHHWLPIKTEWAVFTDLFVNCPLHIVMCGRAGWEYEYTQNEDDGKMDLMKTGTKMRAETEMGYEPSLLLEMERIKGKTIGATMSHRCYVIKDRADQIDGKFFDNPTFKDLMPHIEFLNIGGKHHAVDTTRSSRELFKGKGGVYAKLKRKEILFEEITDEMKLLVPGRTELDQQSKIQVARKVFGTSSWTAIKELPIETLEKCLKKLQAANAKKANKGGK